ncbi:cleavage and polyadenylation specificity factor [Sarcoptes scabiei]|nr:cleavage and polyadenylation specificity factor [Sarcoptes scabiei]
MFVSIMVCYSQQKQHRTDYTGYELPGDGGSQLEARLNKTEVPHYFCVKQTNDYFSVWLNLELLVPFVIDCWVDNMKLIYDNKTRSTKDNVGVEIRVPGFGNTTTIEYVDTSRLPISEYFGLMVENLIEEFGYERGVNIRGAPYDFRKAPNELQDYLVSMKRLIEETYERNHQQRVMIVCHSMGCLLMLRFFNLQKQSWKNQFVQSFITLGAPWGGAVKSVKAFISGDNFGVIVAPSLTIRDDERTFPSLAYLLPNSNVFDSNLILVETRDRKYTIRNYDQLFRDINYPVGHEMWNDVKNLTYTLEAPGVEVYCIYGTGSDTMKKIIYERNRFPDEQPDRIEYGDGDGTVNIESLSACKRWQREQRQPVHHYPIKNLDHMKVLSDINILNNLKKFVTKSRARK